MDPRGTVGRIYKEDHYTLLLTKYESSGPCGFGAEYFLCFSHYKSMGANDPWGGAIFDPRGMIGRIYIEDLWFEEEDFFMSSPPPPPPPPPGQSPYGPQGHGWQDL